MLTIDEPELERVLRAEAERAGESEREVLWRLLAQSGRSEAAAAEPTRGRRGPLARMPEELEAFLARIRKIQDEIAAFPVLDPRDPDEIMYDEHGLPK